MRRFLAFCLVLMLSACASTPTTATVAAPIATDMPTATGGPTATTAPFTAAPKTRKTRQPPATPVLGVVTVFKADGSKFSITVADLQKLPVGNITVGTKKFEGPKLKDILAAAGVTVFQKIYLFDSYGNGKTLLAPEQVNDNTLLTITDTNIIRLATTYINVQYWTQNVARIVVQ